MRHDSPSIDNFTNATHDHSSSAQGGLLTRAFTVSLLLYNGGSVLQTGLFGAIRLPHSGTITGWEISSVDNTSGSIVIDVWKDTYGNLPPTVADTITGSEKPTITASTKGQDLTLSTWTTSVTAGDWWYFNIDSVTSLKQVSLNIIGTKTT